MFKNLTQFAQLLRGAGKLSERLHASKKELGEKKIERQVEGTVQVELNGLGQVQSISIAEHMVASGHQSQLQEAIRKALNEAIQESRRLHLAALQKVTGGLDIPGLDELIADLEG